MAAEIPTKYASPVKLTWGSGDDYLEGLANGDAVVSNLVTNTSPSKPKATIQGRIKVGASAPTDNGLISFWLIRSIDSVLTGGLAASTEYTAPADVEHLKRCAKLVHAISVADVASETYEVDFVIKDPGPSWALAVVNDCGQALDSADASQEVNYLTMVPESQ